MNNIQWDYLDTQTDFEYDNRVQFRKVWLHEEDLFVLEANTQCKLIDYLITKWNVGQTCDICAKDSVKFYAIFNQF
jgi:hypothetical protein